LIFNYKIFLIITIIAFFLLKTNESNISATIIKPLVIINNVTTIPDVLHVGDLFDLNVTISNLYPYNVQILSFGCKGPINLIFDNLVEVNSTGSGMCTNFEPIINLKSNETKTLLAPDIVSYYKTIKPGIINGEIQLEYYKHQDDLNELDIQNISKKYTSFISHPFSFQVMP
jgi:hypothetical protein